LAVAQLVGRYLRFDAADPFWHDRDRIVAEPSMNTLANGLSAALESNAPLATLALHAIGCGVGLALAERSLAARFGRSLVGHRAWVLCGGAALATGAVQEAAWLAGAWRLGRLTVLASVDNGEAPGLAGFAANGWLVRRAAADDPAAIGAALSAALRSLKPTLIACIGEVPAVPSLHPTDRSSPGWREAGHRLAGVRRAWLKRLMRHGARADFERTVAGRLPERWHFALTDLNPVSASSSSAPHSSERKPSPAGGTTSASTAGTLRQAIAAIAPALHPMVLLPGQAGWAAPAGQAEPPACSAAVAGRLAMGMNAVVCGTAMHGGLLPVSVQASDPVESVLPGLRLAARSGLHVVQVLVEPDPGSPQAGQRACLRALHGLLVFRPGDTAEALECLELAIRRQDGPSALLVSEVVVPILADRPVRMRSARGAYILAEAPGIRDVTLIASGPELSLALRVRNALARSGLHAAVVSLPCWELFAQQDPAWRDRLLGEAPRVGLESGSGFGWERWLAARGLFICPRGIGDDHAAMVAGAVRGHLNEAEQG
jgi:transketolase